MVVTRLVSVFFVGNCLLLLFCSGLSNASEADIACLKTLKEQFKDPNGYLSNWVFGNSTPGYICKFSGVSCWHDDENRVLSIKLPGYGVGGEFPRGVKECTSLTALDLSKNNLSGTLPTDISSFIGLATTLDLSYNGFSGEIPVSVSNISFLNTLMLNDNRFTGQIPPQLALLGRLKKFSVANNLLTGPVPNLNSTITQESYDNNLGLCGKPLDPCSDGTSKSRGKVIVIAAAGGVTGAAIIVGIGLFIYFRRFAVVRKKDDDPEGNKWAKDLKTQKGIKVSMFEKSVSKMKLSDLMRATNEFNKDNIIGSGRTGAMYKGVLEDGTALMIKRLQDSQHSEKEFISEMMTLGTVKHRNLVPLLGFCVAKKERLLIYEYMLQGSLYDNLHPTDEASKPMDWPLRLKIAIGAAKGFAWLHHSCNPRIIHRNISSKCILLSADFEPKISDFGLARLMNPVDTHLSTFVNGEFGEFGYVAPEYTRTLVATPKGDVYSFGVVLLELVTSEIPTSITKVSESEEESFKGNLVEWITKLSGESKLRDAMDKSLLINGVDEEVFRVLKVACNCVLSAAKERPTMFEVYQFLRAIGESYHFTTEDDILVPTESGGADFVEELIVAR
ncbi:PREDICTED: probably inactive leucine-rich repeat receptor-like protein kinase At5g48380 [Tarenaya hassleriana]|uniref:probably inactive leucine-rich repeat receptor-like protein kinase At5g48380 n=1 Tax=Tarenaya hassleriana TaxID=28532 RepID=UPI00053CA0F0|nr:PREDICTED: probably inactive leucine-rich repeat receptor-like protein kinase At5g48380 [Tarenaya hassleriana]